MINGNAVLFQHVLLSMFSFIIMPLKWLKSKNKSSKCLLSQEHLNNFCSQKTYKRDKCNDTGKEHTFICFVYRSFGNFLVYFELKKVATFIKCATSCEHCTIHSGLAEIRFKKIHCSMKNCSKTPPIPPPFLLSKCFNLKEAFF